MDTIPSVVQADDLTTLVDEYLTLQAGEFTASAVDRMHAIIDTIENGATRVAT